MNYYIYLGVRAISVLKNKLCDVRRVREIAILTLTVYRNPYLPYILSVHFAICESVNICIISYLFVYICLISVTTL